MYDPKTGTFISEDPLGFLAGDANLYRYVGNAPTNLTDPSGNAPNKQGTTDPQHLLDWIKELEGGGLSPQEILARIRDGHVSNENRYFYTDQYGWVDIRHFAQAANWSMSCGSVVTEGLGFALEFEQWITEWGDDYRSGFSTEDLPSNSAGADFGDDFICPEMSLFDAAKAFLAAAGARNQHDPKTGWENLPPSDPAANGGGAGSSGSTGKSNGSSDKPGNGSTIAPTL